MLLRSAILLSTLLISTARGQKTPEPIRLCVAVLENSSSQMVATEWQRDQLIRAFDRVNKSKDVKKGKAAGIDALALQSTKGTDSDIRDKNCRFVLYTNLVEIQKVREVSVPPAGAVAAGGRFGDARADPPDYHSATIGYQVMRAGDPQEWSSGMVTAQEAQQEDTLVSGLMIEIANRVASDLRKPHPASPQ
jgi:hypothetical protein